jgi:hypothetical protein
MKKSFLLLILGFAVLSSDLLGRPYLSKYSGENEVIIFEGSIKDEDEPAIVRLQTLYLQSLYVRPNRLRAYEFQLKELGVTITRVERDPYVDPGNVESYYPPTSPSTPQTQSHLPGMPGH